MQSNFFDEMDTEWGDLISDVYEKYNIEYYIPDTILDDNDFIIIESNIAENDIIINNNKVLFPRLGKGIIKIPDNVNIISQKAFTNCNSILNIEFPKSLLYIENNAFSNCKNLKKLKFNEGLEYIGSRSFFSCSSLTNINLPSTLKNIDSWCFCDCNLSNDLIIPDNVKQIGHGAFYGNKNLNGNLILNDGLCEIEYICFKDCSFTGELKIPESVNYIGANAFNKCNFNKIYIPNNKINMWDEHWDNGLNCEMIYY